MPRGRKKREKPAVRPGGGGARHSKSTKAKTRVASGTSTSSGPEKQDYRAITYDEENKSSTYHRKGKVSVEKEAPWRDAGIEKGLEKSAGDARLRIEVAMAIRTE